MPPPSGHFHSISPTLVNRVCSLTTLHLGGGPDSLTVTAGLIGTYGRASR